jgi:acyl-CoA thioester hydrolase
MIEHVYAFRVAYPDTDKMGTVHHSNYAKYYETARWELLRSIGMPYQILEQMGYMLPVISMSFKFRKTTRYDEQLTVRTTLKEIRGARIWFTYKLYNESSELINEAETELAFVMEGSWKPCATPDFLKTLIDKHSKKALAHIAS